MRQHATALPALEAGYQHVGVSSDSPQPDESATNDDGTDGICYLVFDSVHCTSIIITHYVLHVNKKTKCQKNAKKYVLDSVCVSMYKV